MKKRCMVQLIKDSITKSKTGFQTREKNAGRTVLAKVDGVKRAEFYQAHAAGMKPSAVFTVDSRDYEGQTHLVHDKKRYRIVRTYPVSGNDLELVCEGDYPHDA